MRRVLMTALASAAIGMATPVFAVPLPVAQQTGPDLTTKIYASGDSGVATVGNTVFGNTSPGAGHDVQFSGYSQFNAGTNSGTATTINITGGNGFAQIADNDFVNPTGNNPNPSQDNLFAVIMNPDANFYMYEFSMQTLVSGMDVNIFYMLANDPTHTWILATGSPLQNGNGDTQYIFGSPSDPSVAIDQILIESHSAIEHLKQNSIQLTGTRPSVPEPATWGLMLLGFAGVGVAMRRSRKNRPALMQVA